LKGKFTDDWGVRLDSNTHVLPSNIAKSVLDLFENMETNHKDVYGDYHSLTLVLNRTKKYLCYFCGDSGTGWEITCEGATCIQRGLHLHLDCAWNYLHCIKKRT